MDGNEAAASVAHRLSEVIAIYPITPSSPMGELSDEWSAEGRTNVWGSVPSVVEMQSEAGAAGAVHGALQAGALTTTFTASQGLLLMIPNMYKIAGELTPFCMHVAARTLATHALSIFGDHSDVMACRQVGFAMLASGSVQEAHDLAAIAHAATLESRVPFCHFFDGFRTSHEIASMEPLSDEFLKEWISDDLVAQHQGRRLTPDHPVLRGTAQNPDVFFQAREAANGFYDACPGIVSAAMERFGRLTGRRYRLFDYFGHPEAERVIVVMGSGAETAHETADFLAARGEKVGVVQVRLFRPFSVEAFVGALPRSVRAIAVLDRTKEPGCVGEPLYQDVVTALAESPLAGAASGAPRVIGGRFGLSSKEFHPGMVKAVFDELAKPSPKNHFTIGIMDDVTHTSLPFDPDFDVERPGVVRAVFFGLGADGTVGANKNSVKILADETGEDAQGYFVYDSKKSGAVTISHLRFGPGPIRSAYLVRRASFVGCHQFEFVNRLDVLETAEDGAAFLLNSPHGPDRVWDQLPVEVQQQIVEKRLRFYVIDAYRVAREAGMKNRINTVMQTCFFAISGVLPADRAIEKIKEAIAETYASKGADVLRRNNEAVDRTIAALAEVPCPDRVTSTRQRPPVVSDAAPDFVKRVTGVILANHGDRLPVSAFPVDGTWPMGTTRWEKRNIATEIPVWDSSLCIQCNKCALVCPHAAIRAKVYEPAAARRRAGHVPVHGFQGGGFRRVQVHDPGCAGRLHRVLALRDVLPRKGQVEPEAQVHQHGAAGSSSRAGAGKLRLLPRPAGGGPLAASPARRQGIPVLPAALRVLGGVRGMRRDALHQALDPALRRSHADRERHRLQLHLRRQPSDDAVHGQPRWTRTGLVQLALRRQRGVRSGHAAGAREPERRGATASRRARLADRRRAHRAAPLRGSVEGCGDRPSAGSRRRAQVASRSDAGPAKRGGSKASRTTSSGSPSGS